MDGTSDKLRSGHTDKADDSADTAMKSDTDPETHPSNDKDEPSVVFECPVCLQTASFPVQLPCRHIFCFLCVKGVANRSKRCAMCRQEIPADFFHDPKLLHTEEVTEKSKTIFDDGYQWFYEGRNGWWQYDERTSTELENKYKNGDKMFELLIAGFLYVIDLESMRQFRRNDQTRRRKIKRDMCSIPGIKGIAGLKYQESQQVRPSGDGGEASNTSNPNPRPATGPSNQSVHPPSAINDRGPVGAQDDSYLGPPAPNNTPQAPMTPADSQPGSLSNSQEDLSLHLQNLQLSQPLVGRSRPDSPNFPHPLYEQVEYITDDDDSATDNDVDEEEDNADFRSDEIEEYRAGLDNVRETCL